MDVNWRCHNKRTKVCLDGGKKKERAEESEESRSKVRIRCDQGVWYLEVKEERANMYYHWKVVSEADSREKLDGVLAIWRNRMYYLHSGTVEYY